MKKVTIYVAALVLLLGGATSGLKAQTTPPSRINVVTSAVPFLS